MPDRWRNIDYSRALRRDPDIPDSQHVVADRRHASQPGAIPWNGSPTHDARRRLPTSHPDDVLPAHLHLGHDRRRRRACSTPPTPWSPRSARPPPHSAMRGGRQPRRVPGRPHRRRHRPAANVRVRHVDGRRWISGTRRSAARLVEEHRVTTTAGAPFFLASLLDEAERQGTRL